jgi:UTP--glucose-1-phosphate uridylyltransferase
VTTAAATVTTAVFPVAGLGTRFLPATKAMPKELMPIIDRPLIQYAVEEAIAAGITKLVFVTGRTKRAIADHFDAAPELERALEEAGKDELAALVRETLPPHVHAVYIRQRAALGLGHAVLCARPAVGDAPFAVLLADEFIVAEAGAPNPTAELAQAMAATGRSQVLLQEVMPSHTQKYGIAVPGAAPDEIAGLIEKPSPGDAPSQLASIGRYVLHPEIFDVLEGLAPGQGGEIQLADAIDALARIGRVGARSLRGTRHDCGSHLGYLGAVIAAASRHPEFGGEFRDLMSAELAAAAVGG